jgi:hypothetical protein
VRGAELFFLVAKLGVCGHKERSITMWWGAEPWGLGEEEEEHAASPPSSEAPEEADSAPFKRRSSGGTSHEFEDVDLRRPTSLTPDEREPGSLATPLWSYSPGHRPLPIPLPEARPKGSILSRTPLFGREHPSIRRSRSGVIDQSAVPDPDVVLLADAVLANRPVTSAAQREEGNAATAAAAPSSSSTRRGSLLGKIGRSRKAPLPQSERPGRDVVADDGDWGAYAGNGLESALDANALEAMSSRSVGISRHNTPPHEGAATTPGDSLRRKVELLSAQLAATEAALRASQEQSHHWQLCVRDLFNGLLLNPRMNSKYELKASKMLEHAIAKLDLIGARTRRSHTPARWREAEPARAQCTRLRTRRGPSWPPLSLPAQPALRPPP